MKKAPAETQEKKVLKARDLELSFDSRRVFISGKEVNLTAKEFDLLEHGKPRKGLQQRKASGYRLGL